MISQFLVNSRRYPSQCKKRKQWMATLTCNCVLQWTACPFTIYSTHFSLMKSRTLWSSSSLWQFFASGWGPIQRFLSELVFFAWVCGRTTEATINIQPKGTGSSRFSRYCAKEILCEEAIGWSFLYQGWLAYNDSTSTAKREGMPNNFSRTMGDYDAPHRIDFDDPKSQTKQTPFQEWTWHLWCNMT